MAKRRDPQRFFIWIVVIVLGLIGLAVAPMFMPFYRWLEVDFVALAEFHKVKVDELSKERSFLLRYEPRGEDDPCPWQLIVEKNDGTPSWEVDPDGDRRDETRTLVRVRLVSDRNGKPPSTMWVRSTIIVDKYFTARGWRLPRGALGQDVKRPVLLMQESTFDRMSTAEAQKHHYTLQRWLKQRDNVENGWISDDDPELFPERADGYISPRDRKKLQDEAAGTTP